jgi:uncharacterized protein (TIGR02996 family)
VSDVARLLERWAEARHERVAAAIEQISARVTQDRPHPAGKTVAAKQQAWLELAARDDADDIGALLATFDNVKKARELVERLDALAKRPADPRIAAALVKLVEFPVIPGSTGIEPLNRVLAMLVAIGDPRSIRELERIAEADVGGGLARWHLRRTLPDTIAQLRARVATLSTSLPEAALAEIESGVAWLVAPPAADLESLYAAVYANPDDDAPRAVLADALQEAGDARGEFIALQLARAKRRSARERELLAAHGREWLGEIEPLVQRDAVFERGFLAKCSVTHAPSLIERLRDRPEWRTITNVRCIDARLASSMPVLRVLRETAQLPEHHATLAEVQLAARNTKLADLAAPVELPMLRSLAAETFDSVSDAEPFLKSALAKQLEHLALDVYTLEPWLAAVTAIRVPSVVLSTHRHHAWRYHFEGDTVSASLLWSFAEPEARYQQELVEHLGSVPRDRFKRLVVELDGQRASAELARYAASFAASELRTTNGA